MDSDKKLQRQYYQVAKKMLNHRSGTNGEDLYFYNTRTKKWYSSTTGTQAGTPDYTEEIRRALQESEKMKSFRSITTHLVCRPVLVI